ncbi:MAG: hypothetical protein L6Q71_01040 [Planctomycetes bacterium]|nr:hypothetical protein [Planctomycetota bacterium]
MNYPIFASGGICGFVVVTLPHGWLRTTSLRSLSAEVRRACSTKVRNC